MNVFEQLKQVTIQAQDLNELPDFLAERIFRIASDAAKYQSFTKEIEALACQIDHYDTYGQTGYMGMGVNNAILEGAIRRLEEKVV